MPMLCEIISKLCDVSSKTYSEVRNEYKNLDGYNYDFSELEKY